MTDEKAAARARFDAAVAVYEEWRNSGSPGEILTEEESEKGAELELALMDAEDEWLATLSPEELAVMDIEQEQEMRRWCEEELGVPYKPTPQLLAELKDVTGEVAKRAPLVPPKKGPAS